jgi:transmembrane sensor
VLWIFRTAQERLDDQAARWLVRMQGSDRERFRPAFERWLAASPAHAEAYEEALISQQAGGLLERSEVGRSRRLPEARKARVPLRYALAGAALAFAALAVLLLTSAYVPPSPSTGREMANYSTRAGQQVWLDLPDGSRMKLGGSSVAEIAFTKSARAVRLKSGTARFSVAHEERPFRVFAGEALVVARGTVFEVSLGGGRTTVSLIEGSVEISRPAASRASDGRIPVTRLRPGQRMTIGDPPRRASASAASAAPDLLEFDNTELSSAVAEFNRRGADPIRLGSREIGRLRVTGAFRAGDSEAFAQSLATAFRLRVERRLDGTLVLRSLPANSAAP